MVKRSYLVALLLALLYVTAAVSQQYPVVRRRRQQGRPEVPDVHLPAVNVGEGPESSAVSGRAESHGNAENRYADAPRIREHRR